MFRIVVSFFLVVLSSLAQTNRYVWLNGSHIPPFTNWATASTNIQDAIDISSANDIIWVTNGVYETGGRPHTGEILTNRVYINKVVTVRSVSTNPANTVIVGKWNNPYGSIHWTNACGDAAVRCVYMSAGSKLFGFTITNGATRTSAQTSGGGIFGANISSVVSNCFIINNIAWGPNAGGGGVNQVTIYDSILIKNISRPIWDGGFGGGARNSVLYNCILKGNSSGYAAGGAYACTLYNCDIIESGTSGGQLYGSAADVSTLYNCNVISNMSGSSGVISYSFNPATPNRSKAYNCFFGWNRVNSVLARNTTFYNCIITYNRSTYGIQLSELYNSLLVGNEATISAGAAIACQLYNCTIVGNSAKQNAGGTLNCTNWNTIAYFNYSGSNNNYSNSVFNYSCTFPDPGVGVGNITNNPELINCGIGYGTNHVFGNYRLDFNSLCINSGTNFSWMTNSVDFRKIDLDDRQRIRNYVVDMGSYEAWSIEKGLLLIRSEDSLPK